MQDFIMLPRKIKNDYLAGKLTLNELMVLVWIWLNTNPVNGLYSISYDGLRQDLRGSITKNNARKIISSLRKGGYVYFLDHKGRTGSFPLYSVDFPLTNGRIQDLDSLKNKLSISSQSQPNTQPTAKLENSLEPLNHNLIKPLVLANGLKNGLPDHPQSPQITTPYNDNDKYNKSIDRNNPFTNERPTTTLKKNEPPAPTLEQQTRLLEIADTLREKNPNSFRGYYQKYGMESIEWTWSIVKEKLEGGDISDPPAYFNKVIQEVAKRKVIKIR